MSPVDKIKTLKGKMYIDNVISPNGFEYLVFTHSPFFGY